MATDKKNSKNKKSIAKQWVQGRSFLTLDFFRRNGLYILGGTALIMMKISKKYEYQNCLQQVISLSKDLENAETDCVMAGAKYNSQIRESEMMMRIDTSHIDLTMPDQPPYKIKDK